MQNGDDLEWRRLWTVDNGAIRIAGQRPETKWQLRQAGPQMATQGSFGNEGARLEACLFYTVGGFFAAFGDQRPDAENIRFGEVRKKIYAHYIAERHSSFIA
jgi:hypothetical protein